MKPGEKVKYPLELSFRIIALASQIYVKDAQGNSVFYVKQKMFKLKENIEIYNDETKSQLLFTLKADRIIDFSPQHTLTDANNQECGIIKRNGGRSLWKADYTITVEGQQYTIKEHDAWVKVLDTLLGMVPIIGAFSGYLFHPKYDIVDNNQKQLATLVKTPAFFEGRFQLEAEALANMDAQKQTIFAALTMVVALMERSRG